jgi:glycosyltransferase involved in cell wall biosynthesis
MARTLSVVMIVKNEALHLRECIEGLQGLYDELCVLDTGSTDDTRTIAEALGARVGEYTWSNDFAAARNASLELCTCDWVFVMDADERLAPEDLPRIRNLMDTADGCVYSLPVRNYTNDASLSSFTACSPADPLARGFAGWFPARRVRLYPNRTAAQYEGRIHELIDHSFERLGYRIVDVGIPVHHYAFEKRDPQRVREKQLYYLELGLQKVRENPGDAKGYMELGNQYAELGQYQQAAAAYRESLKRRPEDADNLKNLGGVLLVLGRGEQAAHALKLALQYNPRLAEAWRNLGVAQAQSGAWTEALRCFDQALNCEPGWLEGRRYRAVALAELDRVEEAAEEAARAVEALPGQPECLDLYLKLMERQDRRGEAREHIHRIMRRGIGRPALERALARLG